MSRGYDGHNDVLRGMRAMLESPNLDAVWLGRIVVTLDAFVRSELMSQQRAAQMLADRRWQEQR